MKNAFTRFLLPLAPLVLGTAVLEFLTRREILPAYLFPAPSRILDALTGEGAAALWTAAGETGLASAAGFIGSLVVGTLVGAVLASSRLIERTFSPYAVFFQTVPIIAIAPLLVIWFGYGLPTVIISAWIVSVFPMIAATLAGIRGTEPALRDLFRLYEAPRSVTLRKLLIPSALPSILTGARIAAGLAVIGAIVGEFIAGGGLGGMIDTARTQQRLDLVFAAILLSALLGWIFFASVNLASRILLRHWHAAELTTERN